jgi:hypothetical protein
MYSLCSQELEQRYDDYQYGVIKQREEDKKSLEALHDELRRREER